MTRPTLYDVTALIGLLECVAIVLGAGWLWGVFAGVLALAAVLTWLWLVGWVIR